MGHRSRYAVALALVASVLSCEESIIVLGDSPGIVRVAVGIPDAPGDLIGRTALESHLQVPIGLAVSTDGTLYLADSQNSRVLAITSAGEVSAAVEGSRSGLGLAVREPSDVALDENLRRIVIADPVDHRLWQVDLETVEAAPLAGTGVSGISDDGLDALESQIAAPFGVAVGDDGLVYFTDTNTHRVRRIEPDGSLLTIAGTGAPGDDGDGGPAAMATFLRPKGLVFGGGSLYIADSGNHRIRRVDLETNVVETVAGNGFRGFSGDEGTATSARLDNPSSVAVTSDGANMFIADTGNHRVRVVSLSSGIIRTFAGTGSPRFNGDLLSAGETALSAPEAIAISPFDLLFISDTGHHVVRRTAVGLLVAE